MVAMVTMVEEEEGDLTIMVNFMVFWTSKYEFYFQKQVILGGKLISIFVLDFAGGFGGGAGFGGGFGGFKRSLERRMDTAKKQIEGKRIH